MTLASISLTDLATITGGASAQAQQVCNRAQFDWMAAHMVPDNAVRPGVQRHTIAADAKLCGFPMPK